MNPSPKHRFGGLLLALLLAFGMSVSLVQGSLMAAEVALPVEAAEPCPHGCDGCADGDGDHAAGICLSACGSAAHGLLPGEPLALPPVSRASFQTGCLDFGGRSQSPDPGPPRSLILG